MGIFDKLKKKQDVNGSPAGKGNGVGAEEDDVKAYGWDAITECFERLYPGQTNPKHLGTLIKYHLGGPDPLDGVSIYDGGESWHFITFGFSDLYEKTPGEDPEWSGWGFELTLKLKKYPWVDETEIRCVASVLQSLARYVYSSKKRFHAYEYIWTKQTEGFDANGKSKLTGFATLPDEAGAIETPNGKLEFICVVGLSDSELRSIAEKQFTVRELLEKLGSPLTDYEREEVV